MSIAPAVTQAAADPFAAVPFGSGLYEDVAALVHDGLIYGYTDSSFDKTHQLSRYEMAIFTGKALSAYKNASPADQARIQKLAGQFKNELTSMGATNIPGGRGKGRGNSNSNANSGGNNKARMGNVTISGKVEHLWNAEKKKYGNRQDSNRYNNDTSDKNFDIEVFPTLTANLGGGWQGELGFYGAKNRGGLPRANENVDGHFDITRYNVSGPINKRSWIKIGRDKSSTFKSIVMGEYWTGVQWKQKINKHLTVNYTWAKPDYAKNDDLVGFTRNYQVRKYYLQDDKKTIDTKNTKIDKVDNKLGQLDYYRTDPNDYTTATTIPKIYSQTIQHGSNKSVSSLPDVIWDEPYLEKGKWAVKKYEAYVTPSPISGEGVNGGSTAPMVPIYDDKRSVADTYVNPADTGITFGAIEANYKFSNKWRMNLGYWATDSNKNKTVPSDNAYYTNTFNPSTMQVERNYRRSYVGKKYQSTRLGEIQLAVQPTHKWALALNLAKSNRDEQNTAWMFNVQYGRYSKDVPHTWATSLHIGRCGRESYIKSGYDMKNDDYGGKGLEYYFTYVPRKNLVANFRYMIVEPLEVEDALHDYRQEQFRGELDWYF